MTERKPKNIAASVRERLLNLSKSSNENYQFLMVRYALERILYRLSKSEHKNQFILKGAMLFYIWSKDVHRPTRDLDLLGYGLSEIEPVVQKFKEILSIQVEDDGIEILVETVKGSKIKEDQDYEGVRLSFECRLANARIPIQIDIGFGDVVVPYPEETEYPSLLDLPKPRLKAYKRETVIAEKFNAMVELGISNSRMKDFYDIWTLARNFHFDIDQLSQAIKSTFNKRGTKIPTEPPLSLTPTFYEDKTKQEQWRAFLRKLSQRSERIELEQITEVLKEFLIPASIAAATEDKINRRWKPPGTWQ
jgi:predicted nucleotidyltransferase component of viral defense system